MLAIIYPTEQHTTYMLGEMLYLLTIMLGEMLYLLTIMLGEMLYLLTICCTVHSVAQCCSVLFEGNENY